MKIIDEYIDEYFQANIDLNEKMDKLEKNLLSETDNKLVNDFFERFGDI